MKKLLAFKWTLSAGALILVALLLPSGSIPKISSPLALDKVAHCILFFLFAFAFGEEYRRERKTDPRLLEDIAIIVPFIIFSELLQLLTSTRHFEWLDMAADSLGAVLALLIRGIVHRWRKG
ncbi:MAG TPA: VanZ family protein [Rectinemataceae bacterium]